MMRIALLSWHSLLAALLGACGGLPFSAEPASPAPPPPRINLPSPMPALLPKSFSATVVMASQLRGFSQVHTSTASAGFEAASGEEVAPLGLGSYWMRTGDGDGPDQGGKVFFGSRVLTGIRLSEITHLSYATRVRETSTAAAYLAPALVLQLDVDGDGQRDTSLVYEPVYSTEQGKVGKGVWQRWDAWSGRFWLTVAAGGICALDCFMKIEDLLHALPAATIVDFGGSPSLALVAGQRSGGIWAGFEGAVDALALKHGGASVLYDFEPEAAACHAGAHTRSRDPSFESLSECLDYHR